MAFLRSDLRLFHVMILSFWLSTLPATLPFGTILRLVPFKFKRFPNPSHSAFQGRQHRPSVVFYAAFPFFSSQFLSPPSRKNSKPPFRICQPDVRIPPSFYPFPTGRTRAHPLRSPLFLSPPTVRQGLDTAAPMDNVWRHPPRLLLKPYPRPPYHLYTTVTFFHGPRSISPRCHSLAGDFIFFPLKPSAHVLCAISIALSSAPLAASPPRHVKSSYRPRVTGYALGASPFSDPLFPPSFPPVLLK